MGLTRPVNTMNEQIPNTNRRSVLAAAPLVLGGCTSQTVTSNSSRGDNNTTRSDDYNGVKRPDLSEAQASSDVMDDDVAAIATADDPKATAVEQGSPTTSGGLLVVAYMNTEKVTESDAPEEFSRVVVVTQNRIEGVVPFDQLTELAADEMVERLATAQIAVQESNA